MNEADNGFEYEGCSTALARTENPQTSKDAAEKMVKSGELNRQEKEVYKAILKAGKKDFTTKEIAAWMFCFEPYHKAYDICRKRFSDIEMKNKIELIWLGVDKKGKNIYKRRDGCRVWRLV